VRHASRKRKGSGAVASGTIGDFRSRTVRAQFDQLRAANLLGSFFRVSTKKTSVYLCCSRRTIPDTAAIRDAAASCNPYVELSLPETGCIPRSPALVLGQGDRFFR
jgi:hypothetical protein